MNSRYENKIFDFVIYVSVSLKVVTIKSWTPEWRTGNPSKNSPWSQKNPVTGVLTHTVITLWLEDCLWVFGLFWFFFAYVFAFVFVVLRKNEIKSKT